MKDKKTTDIDWSLTTFEGASREQLRRWSELPLETILAAVEEMEDIARELADAPVVAPGDSEGLRAVKETRADYEADDVDRNSSGLGADGSQ